jgi:hypothetical protein
MNHFIDCGVVADVLGILPVGSNYVIHRGFIFERLVLD